MLRWSAAVLPIAAVVAADPAGWNPFGPAKWAAVSTTVAVLALDLVRRRRWRVPTVAAVLWIVLLGLAVASALGAVDGWYAWVGTPERHFGVLTWVLLAVCFVGGAQLDGGHLIWIGRGSAVAAVWLGAYASVERWIGRPIDISTTTDRLGGPFGSAAYLGAACCLLVPIAAALAMDGCQPCAWRLVGAAGAALGAFALVGSGGRAAWLGMAVAAGVVVVVTRRRRLVVALAGLAALGTLVMLPRLADVVDREHGPWSRIDEWWVARDVVADHVWLGVGPEGYRVVVGAEIDAAYERSYGRDVMPDRAHSSLLDVGTTLGVPAAVVYAALVVLVMAGCVTWCRRAPLEMGLAVGVMAYFVGQLLLFPIAELDPFAWLVGGAVLAGTGRVREVVIGARARMAGTGVAAAAAVAVIVSGVTDIAADRLARRAVDRLGTVAAVADAERAADLRPDLIRLQLLEAAAAEATGTLGGTDQAIASTERAGEWSPRDPVVRLRLAIYRSRRAEITGVDDDVAAALVAWQDLAGTDPNCFECQLGLGRAAAMADDAALAEAAWRRAVTLTDDDPRPAELLRELDEATS